jgi:DNA-binding transcriptional LysR family regulator
MDAAALKVFAAVARLGGMNRAAAELNTVQSNVTTRIRRLEEELGTTLFERHGRGVTLTAAGRRLWPYAARVDTLLDEARRAVVDDGRPQGSLAIGSLETTAALRLSPILATYAATFPDVDLVLRTGTTRELIDATFAREVEGAFVCGPVDHPQLGSEPVFREQLAVATAPKVRSLEDLGRERDLKLVVLRAGCSYRQRLEEILARRGVVGLRQLEFGTIESIIGCVAGGLGVTLLPGALLEPIRRSGRIALHALPAEEGQVDTVFVRHRDAYVSSALAAFLECARRGLAEAAAAE